MLICFMAIWNILQTFGIFNDHLLHFCQATPPQKKNNFDRCLVFFRWVWPEISALCPSSAKFSSSSASGETRGKASCRSLQGADPTTTWADPTTTWADPTTTWADPTTTWANPTTTWADPTTTWANPTTTWAYPTTTWADPTITWAGPTTTWAYPTTLEFTTSYNPSAVVG
jgi:hypothetical protein